KDVGMTLSRDARSRSGYLNFDLLIAREGDRYRVRVIGSPSGEEEDTFSPPFSRLELETYAVKLAGSRGMRRMSTQPLVLAKEIGTRLYQTAFTPPIRASLKRAVDEARRQDAAGVRLRFRLDGAPELATLPWEFLTDPDPRTGHFVALAEETPIV